MKRFAVTLLLLALSVSPALAHPGRTAADGCHYCRTNCASWGEVQDARHCHGGTEAPVDTVAPTRIYITAPTRVYTPTPTKKNTPTPPVRPTVTVTPTPTVTETPTPTTEATTTPTITVELKQRTENKGFWARLFGQSRKNKTGPSRGGFWNWFINR